jgi:mannose-1-phosphate guanylyltransferase/mannose-6-phosphate isomerase
MAAAEGYIVTLGSKGRGAATGYSCIPPGGPVAEGTPIQKVDSFVEKPDAESAWQYVEAGYFWSSGNFIFRAEVMQRELNRFESDMAEAAQAALEVARRDFSFLMLDAPVVERTTKKSIDYAVIERTEVGALIPADIGLSDVGTSQAVWELSPRDQANNSVRGQCIIMDAENVDVRSDEHLTAVVGIDGVIVVTTQDAVLLLNRANVDKVKQLVEQLKGERRREAEEHKRSYRPWGCYQSVDYGSGYQVKRIVVKPGAQLSLQKHFHRAKYWIVVKGSAEVLRNNKAQPRARERANQPSDRLHAPHGQSRQDRPRTDRGADWLLSQRRPHHPPRGYIEPDLSGAIVVYKQKLG